MNKEQFEKAQKLSKEIDELKESIELFTEPYGNYLCDNDYHNAIERIKEKGYLILHGFTKDKNKYVQLNVPGFFGGKYINVDMDFVKLCKNYFTEKLKEKEEEFEKIEQERAMIDEKKLIAGLKEYIEEYSELDENGMHNLKWCAMMEALELVEQQEKYETKYRWHNLLENPKDLPNLKIGTEYVEVLVRDCIIPFTVQYDEVSEKFGFWNDYFDKDTLGYLDSEFHEWDGEDIVFWREIELPDVEEW